MAELTNVAVERLLILLSGYDRVVSTALAEAAPDPELVGDASLVVLCTLDLDGPRRPGVLQDLTGLSSGGVSKLLDRMEAAGVVKRTYGAVPGDNRGVLVTITRRGRAVVGRLCGTLATRLPEARALAEEMSALLEA
jgi:DNA-binding MarR family transcriptional regulator